MMRRLNITYYSSIAETIYHPKLPQKVINFCICSSNGLKSLTPRFGIKITHSSLDPESARARTKAYKVLGNLFPGPFSIIK